MTIEISAQFVIGFFIGMIVGAFIHHLTSNNKQALTIEKRLNVLIVLVWLGLTVMSFMLGREMDNIFNFVGGCSVGHLIGFDVFEVYSKIIKGKK